MATCSLCPPGSPEIPSAEIDEHRRVVHAESIEDRTLQVGDSAIVRDVSEGPVHEDGDEWHH